MGNVGDPAFPSPAISDEEKRTGDPGAFFIDYIPSGISG
jgi:hypothetical protein